MCTPELRRHAVTAFLILTGGLAACDTPDDGALEPQLSFEVGWARTAFDVYSQNLYLGGSTAALFDPAVIANPVALVTAVNDFWNVVQASDVPSRMDAIAEAIAVRDPEVVGLQEGLQFVTLNGSFQPDGGGFIDLLGTLQAAIESRGLPYEMAIVQPTTSSALPLEIDFTTGQVVQYLGFTDRVAILKRSDVVVTDMDAATYGAAIPIAPGVEVRRGWTRVTVDHEGMMHNFVNTHLETQRVLPVHNLQAAELMGILDGLGGVTLLAGDLNSDAEGVAGDPSWTPTYGNLIAAGFADLWDLSPHSQQDPGFTCCQDDDLRNETSALDERIDFVLVRSSAGAIPGDDNRRGHFRSDVIGDRPGDRTASGVWPSDHAGLTASIRQADAVADD